MPFFEQALSDLYLAAAQFLNFPGFVGGPPGNITNCAGRRLAAAGCDGSLCSSSKGYLAGDVANNAAIYFNRAATTDAATVFAVGQGRISGRPHRAISAVFTPTPSTLFRTPIPVRGHSRPINNGWHAAGAADSLFAVPPPR